MPEELAEALCWLAKEEQCEAAWKHIWGCSRCQKIYTIAMFSVAIVEGGPTSFVKHWPWIYALFRELRGEEEVDQFITELKRKLSDG